MSIENETQTSAAAVQPQRRVKPSVEREPGLSGTRATNPDSEKNIRRLDSKGTKGFQVVVSRAGVQHAKFFADKKYGGKERARRWARGYRDALLQELAPPVHVAGTAHTKARSNTGIKGVSVSKRKLANGEDRLIVQVFVRPEMGTGFQRTFTVLDASQLEATIARAAQWREEVLAERLMPKRPVRGAGSRRPRRASTSSQSGGERASDQGVGSADAPAPDAPAANVGTAVAPASSAEVSTPTPVQAPRPMVQEVELNTPPVRPLQWPQVGQPVRSTASSIFHVNG